VIIPTIVESTEELQECVKSVIVQRPHRIILSTDHSREEKIRKMAEQIPGDYKIAVTAIPQANKRLQMLAALPLAADTTLTLFLDDDVILPPLFMDWILAPFEDEKVGGAGTNQALKRRESRNFYDYLGDLYLERRNFDCTACNWMDGGLPCLSGRAVMFRSQIVRDQNFVNAFGSEMWWGKYTMNVDDDNFITRWLFSHEWKIQFQNHPECEVLTSLESDRKYLRQCLRWVRSNWRSNLRSMFVERNVW
jgi:cellulose synthase/poly-beta-1,6-N-acetylglucosamine synthase-like glycosyltransferase